MKFVLSVVGKPRDAHVAAAIEEYETRAARYWPLVVREVREEPARSASPDVVRSREAGRLLDGIDARAHLVACDAEGKQQTSEEFSAWMQQQRERAAGDVAFVIGGAYGLDRTVRERAASRLSFAKWTMSHELARLVLAEQLYRAGTIQRGEPYHK